jgi:hypothetical protein
VSPIAAVYTGGLKVSIIAAEFTGSLQVSPVAAEYTGGLQMSITDGQHVSTCYLYLENCVTTYFHDIFPGFGVLTHS